MSTRKDAMAATSLIHLPAELKLQIFLNLPVTSIIRMRNVCRNFVELVDSPENHILLLGAPEARAVGRFQGFVNHAIYFKRGTSFFEALRRYVAHRGIRVDLSGTRDAAYNHYLAFAMHWMYPNVDPQPEVTDPSILTTRELWRILRLASCLVQLHLKRHTSEMSFVSPRSCYGLGDMDEADFVTRYSNDTTRSVIKGSHMNFGVDQCKELYWAESDTEGGILEGVYHRGDASLPLLPDFPLMRLALVTCSIKDDERQDMDEHTEQMYRRLFRFCDVQTLVQLFKKLPKIPNGPYFAHCVKSEWAYEKVEAALAGRGMKRFEKTAVLEDFVRLLNEFSTSASVAAMSANTRNDRSIAMRSSS